MRNGNGTGSVSKLSGNRRNKYRIYAPAELVYDESRGDYIWKQHTIGYAKTKAEAYNILYLYTNNSIIKNDITLDELYKDFHKTQLINSSQAVLSQYNLVYKYLSPLLNKKLSSINEKHLQNLINTSILSTKTLVNFKSMIHRIYEYAMFKRLIDVNYSDHTIVPIKESNRKANIFTEEEIKKYWDNCNEDIVKILLIYLYTGMRRTELYNIKKENIYLNDRYLIGGMKTKAGTNRIIPLHKKIIPFVTEFYNSSKDYLLDNNSIKNSTVLYRMRLLNCKLKFNNLHIIHDTRKTFITRLNNCGANVTDIAKIVGHSTGSITLDLYTIKDKKQLIKTIDLLD